MGGLHAREHRTTGDAATVAIEEESNLVAELDAGSLPYAAAHVVDGFDALEAVHLTGDINLYRGVQAELGRSVLVKVLSPDASPPAGRRFERERTITSTLSGHAGIVPLLDAGVTATLEPYLVVPDYPRGSLAQLISEAGPIGWREATFLVDAIGSTVAELHGRNIVHRDLQPASVMLTDFLMPRLWHFERALETGTQPEADEPAGSAFFTMATSPAGARPAEDVHGLAALLWALLAGQARYPASRIPFDTGLDAPTAAILAQRGGLPAAVDPPPKPVLDLIAAIMAATGQERDPAGTGTGDAAWFVTELRQAVAEAEETEPAAPGSRRRPLPARVAPNDVHDQEVVGPHRPPDPGVRTDQVPTVELAANPAFGADHEPEAPDPEGQQGGRRWALMLTVAGFAAGVAATMAPWPW